MSGSLNVPDVTDDIPDLPEDQPERERHVEEVLDADSPPLEALADYRQVLDAWAVRHGLTLDQALERLEAHPNPVGKAWADKIRADPVSADAMRVSIEDGIAQGRAEEASES